ncbi:hypothetical protein SVAN01_10104 [Stagonosporopsis vannaccii]|nr:hypothetical protein SVAN01_10104 [Stagonosporopsis vannaccii]
MRAPATQSVSVPTANNDISISPTATLHITLAMSPLPSAQRHMHNPRYTPILLPNGVVSTSPSYRASTTAQLMFIPHHPTFLQPRSSEDARKEVGVRIEDKERVRHAALIAHLSAELREDGGSWVDVRHVPGFEIDQIGGQDLQIRCL